MPAECDRQHTIAVCHFRIHQVAIVPNFSPTNNSHTNKQAKAGLNTPNIELLRDRVCFHEEAKLEVAIKFFI